MLMPGHLSGITHARNRGGQTGGSPRSDSVSLRSNAHRIRQGRHLWRVMMEQQQVVEQPKKLTEKQSVEELSKKLTAVVEEGWKREREIRQQPAYRALVVEGKKLVTTIEVSWMRLGQLAAKVETKYGEETLKYFAKDIGYSLCTLERRRSVWNAWADILAPAPKLF